MCWSQNETDKHKNKTGDNRQKTDNTVIAYRNKTSNNNKNNKIWQDWYR